MTDDQQDDLQVGDVVLLPTRCRLGRVVKIDYERGEIHLRLAGDEGAAFRRQHVRRVEVPE